MSYKIEIINDKLSYINIPRAALIIDKFNETIESIIIYSMKYDEFKNIRHMIYNDEFKNKFEPAEIYIRNKIDYKYFIHFKYVINIVDTDYIIKINDVTNESYGYGMDFNIYKINIDKYISNIVEGIVEYNQFIKDVEKQ